MNYFSTDALIVYGYLLITVIVGLWAGRNVKTIQEYAVANRMYGTGVLTITMLATFITGSQAVGYVGYVFDDGILPIISILICGVIICFSLMARYISPHISYFDGCLTLAEIMGRLYGQQVRIFIGVLGIFYCLVIVTLQIIWLGYIGEIIDIPEQWSIVLGGSFLIIYSARGGMKSIAITDIIQFIAITLLVPLAANLLLHKVGGIATILTHVPSNNFKFIYHPSFKDYLVYCLWGLFPAFPLSFPFIQRMLMAKDKRQIAQSQYMGVGYLTVFYVLLTLIGLAAIALKVMGDINMPQQGSKVFVYLAKTYFPAGIKGIIGIGLLAAVMSTADSFLHAAGILVTNDVISPLWKNKNLTTHSLRLSQYATFSLGVIALVIALTYKILPRVQYGGLDLGHGINIIMDFVAIVFTVPLIAGIMGLKTDAKSFYISSVTTLISFFLAKFFLPNLYFIPFTILINALSFFGAHYMQNQSFITTQHFETFVAIETKWRVSSQTVVVLLGIPLQWVKNFIQTFTSIMPNLYLFAVLTIINHLIPLLVHTFPDRTNYSWSLSINTLGVLLCCLLLVKDHWPQALQKYLGAYWLLLLLYCLSFSAAANFLLGGSNIQGVVQVILSVAMLIFLVDWTSFFILAVAGMVIACLVYRYRIAYTSLVISYQAQYLLAYALLFLVSFGKFSLRKPAMSSATQDYMISQRIKNTLLGEQIGLVNNAVQGLSKLIYRYMQNTEEIWMDRRDGFHTLFVNNMQTIEDPDLYQLLVEILPAFQGIENDGKLAVRLLRDAISSRLMATSMELHAVKVCIKNAVFELRINRHSPHSYTCTLYQMVKGFRSQKEELRIITFVPTQGHLHIRDYSDAIPAEKTLPLLKFLSTTDSKELSISNTALFLKALQQSIANSKQGYKEYTLEFPAMELVA